MEKISLERAKELIKEKYSEIDVIEALDDEITSGNWIDYDQMNEEGYDNEYDYYIDYSRGEAENAVITNMINQLKSLYEFDFDVYEDNSLYDYISFEYDCLNPKF